ncbi:hypothetical protein PybrP1_005481 [[Pythium] brassicae (nom. inval.)]|nr:hypothetical protein PybrP1_005481 [[Pythium] brassicae (nom. inval.)]
MRTCSVLSPRSAMYASKGDGTAPMPFWMKRSFVWISALLVIATPMTTSLWPLMYLVMLWMTTSAPRSSGFWKYGDMNVLSTTSSRLCFFATAATAAMSVILSVGFVGDSSHMSFVVGRMCASSAAASLMSTKSKSMPYVGCTVCRK